MAKKVHVEATVNGQAVEFLCEPRQSLLEVLRDELRLTGTKEGCNNGNCGACNVLVDGKLVNSCLVLGVEVDGANVTTVEGLATPAGLDPLQQKFLEHAALQCGICTPGVLVAAKALLDRCPTPSERDVRAWLAGNLCRCTGYDKIVRAVLDAAKQQRRRIQANPGAEKRAMSLPFDATLKELVSSFPADWLTYLELSAAGGVDILSPDLSTVSAFSDIALGLGDGICHIEFFVSRPSRRRLRRFLLYIVLLYDEYDLPIHSFLVLLRPEADLPRQQGSLGYVALAEQRQLTFLFDVVRVWEWPAETLLTGGLGLVPLGRLPEGVPEEDAFRSVVGRLVARIQEDSPRSRQPEMLTASCVLLGLRLPCERARELFKGVGAMRESSTYQMILEEGMLEEARRMLRRAATRKFGPASTDDEQLLLAIADVERLERIMDRVFDASSWQDLLGTE